MELSKSIYNLYVCVYIYVFKSVIDREVLYILFLIIFDWEHNNFNWGTGLIPKNNVLPAISTGYTF